MKNSKIKDYTIRIVKYLLGLFIVTLGISFAIKSGLGSPPVSAFPRTLEVITGGFLKLSVATAIFQSALVLVQIVMLRKKFKLKNLLQVAVAFAFSSMTELSQQIFSFVPTPESIIVKILMILAACVLIALGIALYVPADIVPMPSEGLTKTIADVSGKAFSDIKVIFDCTAVSISAILCLIFVHNFGSIGFGTVILAILVGIINKQFLKLFKKMSKENEK